MLTDFRSVFPEPFTTDDTARGWTNVDAEAGVECEGSIVDEGTRKPSLGVFVRDLGVIGGWRPDAFLVFATGRAGRAIVGGPFEDLGGLGSVVVILETWKGYQAVAFWPEGRRIVVVAQMWNGATECWNFRCLSTDLCR